MCMHGCFHSHRWHLFQGETLNNNHLTDILRIIAAVYSDFTDWPALILHEKKIKIKQKKCQEKEKTSGKNIIFAK